MNSNNTKTRKRTPPSSSVSIGIPTSWAGLSDEQFLYIAELLAGGRHTVEDVRALLVSHLALAAGAALQDLTTADFSTALDALEWMEEPPQSAARPNSMRGSAALHPLLSGVPFSTYITAENYYQGYLASHNNTALDEIGALLYPGFPSPLSAGERYIILLWVSSLKTEYTQLFPDLFRASNNEFATPPEQREVMNAQIRALTGGDVTKTASVLATDTLTALTELNAKAREAREMEERMKNK